MMKLSLVSVLLLVASRALALEYSCPTDPGFCYLDVGNDGCFDAGTDIGPIDALLTAGDFPAPLPPGPLELPSDPGSVVCPPSVKTLVMQADLHWRTALGSDILLYGTKIKIDFADVEIVSGRDLLFHDLKLRDLVSPPYGDLFFQAERDVTLTGKIQETSPDEGKDCNVNALAGNITARPKSSLFGAKGIGCDFVAGGDVVLERFRFSGAGLMVDATGDITLDNVKFKHRSGGTSLYGRNVTSTGRLSTKTSPGAGGMLIDASEDIEIQQLSMFADGNLIVDGRAVTIGVPVNGKVKPSSVRIDNSRIQIDGTDDIHVVRLRAKSLWHSGNPPRIETSGDSIAVLDCQFSGLRPDIEITAGAGSTCDLSGSVFQNAPTTSCDTVIGP